MKLKDGFVLRTVAGSNVVIPTGERSADLNGMISMNETGAFIWKQLETETTEDAIVAALLKNYEVDEEHAKRCVHEFVGQLYETGCLE